MKKALFLLALLLPAASLFGQNTYELPNVPPNLGAPSNSSLTLPRVSQAASTIQTIGITEIRMDYHRPGIYGRPLYEGRGAIAPYGQVWRAGANENTTLSFTHSVTINGEKLEAGKYGLFLIPDKEEWTLVLSKSNSDWGAFFYDEAYDIHRSKVRQEQLEDYHHWLSFQFVNPQYDKVELSMNFGNAKITIPIEVEVNELMVESLRKDLNGVSLRNPIAYNQAAEFCLSNNVNLEEGLVWGQRATRNDRSFTNLMTESGLQGKLGNVAESDKLKDEAFGTAKAGDLVNYGFRIMGPKFDQDRKGGFEAFEKAREIDPSAAFPMFAMGQFYESKPNRSKTDIKKAIELYGMARDSTQVEGLKRGMRQRISLLEKELD